MTEPTSPAPPEEFPGRRFAVRLGGALLVALGLTLALVLWDNARRSTLELIQETTAVGDARYSAIPEPLPAPPFPVLARLDGRPLVPTSYERDDKNESTMQVAGRDAATGLTVYRELRKKPKEPKEPSAGEDRVYYLKVGPGEFIKVKPAP